MFILHKFKKYFARHSLIQIYHTLAYPNSTWCITAWRNMSAIRLKLINVCLNKLLRSICRANHRASAAPLYVLLGLYDIKFFYKYMLGNYVQNMRLRNDDDSRFSLRVETYNTRQTTLQLFQVPTALSSHSKQSVVRSGPRIYNAIPGCEM